MAELSGRTFLVTGANTGIGRATVLELARRGGRVILACRSEEKTFPVLEQIRRGGGSAEFLNLDLSDLSSVRTAASEFVGRGEPLHVLLNNAGVAGQREITKDGFEIQFGVNHLGHFLLTGLLLDHLKASAPSRIVNVSSEAHYQAKSIDYEAVRQSTPTYTGLREYAVSKLCNVLHAQELARRLDGTGVTTYSLHPGAIASDIWRRIPFPFRLLTKLMKSTEQGAETSLYCATAPELADVSGRYYDNRREKAPNAAATPELGAELWERSEAFVSS
jgi:NAD(P)-dependent dehydrogenase (short-subunit alcohol dehydrogenase family)